LNGIWQLTRRGLSEESGKIGSHLVRGLLALFLFFVIVEAQSNNVGTGQGLPIFRAQMLLTHLFLTINGIFGFSQIIVEEREAGTLDLLKLAGVRRLSIILGKTFPRFWDSFLLIALQVPFTLLTITIGGVAWTQVIAVYVGLFTYLVLIAGIGLFASTMSDTSRSAVGLSAALVFVYLLPYITEAVSMGMTLTGWEKYNLQYQGMLSTQSGFTESPWSTAVQFALVVSGALCVATWFGIARRKGSYLSSFPQWWRHRIANYGKVRVWKSAFAWKEYRYLTGGTLRIGLRIALFLSLLWWMAVVQGEVSRSFAWAALLSIPIGIIDGTWSAVRLFSPEIQQRTWPVLSLTPTHIRTIVRQKAYGWLLGISPSIFAPYIFIASAIWFRPPHIDGMDVLELSLGSIVIGLSILAYLHFMVLFSLSWSWKAIPFTLTLTCILVYVYLWAFIPWNHAEAIARMVIFAGTGVTMIGIMSIIQKRIITKLEKLAGSI